MVESQVDDTILLSGNKKGHPWYCSSGVTTTIQYFIQQVRNESVGLGHVCQRVGSFMIPSWLLTSWKPRYSWIEGEANITWPSCWTTRMNPFIAWGYSRKNKKISIDGRKRNDESRVNREVRRRHVENYARCIHGSMKQLTQCTIEHNHWFLFLYSQINM